MADIRRPNINSPTVEGQVREIKNYLHQLVNHLNFIIKPSDVAAVPSNGSGTVSVENTEQIFAFIKDKIITSPEIFNVYYREINRRMSGKFVGNDEFDTFEEETTNNLGNLEETIKKLSSPYELQKDGYYASVGWLNDEETIAGAEIGWIDNEALKIPIARFTKSAVILYDENGVEVVHFSDEEKAFWLADDWTFKIQGGNISDFVIDQGASGIWTYRKWNSGIAEIWGSDVLDPQESEGGTGNEMYSPVIHYEIPFPISEAVLVGSANNTCTIRDPVFDIEGEAGFRLVSPSTMPPIPTNIYITIRGRWK